MCPLPGLTSIVPVDQVGAGGHTPRAVDTRSPAHSAVTSSSLTHEDLLDELEDKHFLSREETQRGCEYPDGKKRG